MSTEKVLQIFKHESFGQVRVIEKEGEPWFIASDVCGILDIQKARNAVLGLDEDEKAQFKVTEDVTEKGACTEGANQLNRYVTCINEAGLYSLILKSRKPEAKAVKRWITHDVLPSIRKHGAYMTPDVLAKTIADPAYAIGLLTALQQEQEARKVAESRVVSLSKKIEVDAPKVIFAGKVMAADETRTIGELSKFLGNHSKIKFGQNKLHRWMREKGYTMRTKNGIEPTQKSLNLGILVATIHVLRPGFNVTVSSVTWKGVLYFMKKFHDLEKNGVWSLGE